MTSDTLHVTCDTWHLTCVTWHVRPGGGWTFSQNFPSSHGCIRTRREIQIYFLDNQTLLLKLDFSFHWIRPTALDRFSHRVVMFVHVCMWLCGSTPLSPRGAKEVPGEQSSLSLFFRPLFGPQVTWSVPGLSLVPPPPPPFFFFLFFSSFFCIPPPPQTFFFFTPPQFFLRPKTFLGKP